HQAQVPPGCQHGARSLGVGRGGNRFDEELGDLARGLLVDLAVDADDAAVGRYGIAFERLAPGFGEGLLFGASARVGVLDDGNGGTGELAGELPRGVEIHQIVVGELLALKLFAAGDARAATSVEGGRLVRVFAVAQVHDLRDAQVQLVRQRCAIVDAGEA